PEGATVWTATLPNGLSLERMVVGAGRTAVLADGNNERSLLIGYRSRDGVVLWKREASPGGESYWPTLAGSADSVVYFSNLSPHWRELNGQGELLNSGQLPTEFVVGTEVVGGFLSDLKGDPILIPPVLLLQ